jgi:hypothetical protein
LSFKPNKIKDEMGSQAEPFELKAVRSKASQGRQKK